MIGLLVRTALTWRRVRLMQTGKRCSECGARFTAPGCTVGPDRRPAHTIHGGAQVDETRWARWLVSIGSGAIAGLIGGGLVLLVKWLLP